MIWYIANCIWNIKNCANIVENQGGDEKVADGLCVGAAKLGEKWKVSFLSLLFGGETFSPLKVDGKICWIFFRYERKDFTVVIQPAFTDVRLKLTTIKSLKQISQDLTFQLELFMRPDKRGKRQVESITSLTSDDHQALNFQGCGLFLLCPWLSSSKPKVAWTDGQVSLRLKSVLIFKWAKV